MSANNWSRCLGVIGALALVACAKDTAPSVDAGLSIAKLPDDIAGKACHRDSDCVSGSCVTTLHIQGPDAGVAADGGYCTASCSVDSDCGHGGSCNVARGMSHGECLSSCTAASDCRDGYVCVRPASVAGVNVSGSCQPRPATDRIADNVVGRACEGDADCGGGRCAASAPLGTEFPGNYCTGHCLADADCGAGATCLVLAGSSEAGTCYARCDQDSDCTRHGYRCWPISDDFRACYPAPLDLPDGIVGQPCADDLDCGGAVGSCMTELPFGSFSAYEVVPAPGGYCSQDCSLDSQCGAGGQCVSHNAGGGGCLAICHDQSDCREGYRCFPHGRDDDSEYVCAPILLREIDAGSD